ncbi:hypothetical protein CAOG_00073 [Capsaspora owczarzaki ATCC 30864]|nr:hypothetical protein CAOG_00073 [Capsaspora owczarzaki ATCC 30864]|eukprot:XP_004364944.2 hypothetical protein CAOG_00073 [Capsaspora owczarzaki ATCC 30864]
MEPEGPTCILQHRGTLLAVRAAPLLMQAAPHEELVITDGDDEPRICPVVFAPFTLGRGFALDIRIRGCSRQAAVLDVKAAAHGGTFAYIQPTPGNTIVVRPSFPPGAKAIASNSIALPLFDGDQVLLHPEVSLTVKLIEDGTHRIVRALTERSMQVDSLASETPVPRPLAQSEPMRLDDDADATPANNFATTLAFPSISTSTYMFDAELASILLVEAVEEFLDAHPDPRIQLLLVDISDSKTNRLVQEKYTRRDKRFKVIVSDLTRVNCRFIVNAANERLTAGGAGTNKAINLAVGPSLHAETKRLYSSAEAGKAYPVKVPSPRRVRFEYVIHVVGPNMNPQRPQCLHNNYEKGSQLLSATYRAMFSTFAKLASV